MIIIRNFIIWWLSVISRSYF